MPALRIAIERRDHDARRERVEHVLHPHRLVHTPGQLEEPLVLSPSAAAKARQPLAEQRHTYVFDNLFPLRRLVIKHVEGDDDELGCAGRHSVLIPPSLGLNTWGRSDFVRAGVSFRTTWR